ncbi:DNA replication and repair protein RecO [Scopulibacillus darangshiensis]|uniref:DNA repair protein RecO n=1 Tax=Scopulibacillus darangshiensis TaxID=442528 RepID=A0A4R2PBE1_9BACL|nr:DNA repair protein RecO [Scopulibacillus darangshiensis]TCP32352.1 DNA replication and repair protein RecO [Scopulibacillus darangshiensis]
MEKAEGIVIKTINYGETNKIITVFTKEHGKVGLMARGAKKTKSRLSAASQLLFFGQFLYQKSKGLGTLYQGETIEPLRNIKADIFKMAYAAYIVEVIDKLTEQNVRNPFLYDLLIRILTYIEEGVDPEVLTLIFDVKMMGPAGIEARFDGCVHCGEETGPFSFSVDRGGYLCKRCAHTDEHALPMSAAAARLLRLFKHIDISRLGKINLKPETVKEMKRIMTVYYDQYSGLHLKSKRFLDQMASFEQK